MYKFELENVLNYRIHVEETIKIEFNGIEKNVEMENRRYDQNREEIKRLASDIERKMQKGILLKECSIYFSCIDHMHQSLMDQKKIIDQLTEKLSIKRDELILAVQNRKIIDKLREHQNRDAICHENKKEIAMLDEFSSQQRRHRQVK
jgi:flagellar protein FliJ